jgi:hypothetical protein
MAVLKRNRIILKLRCDPQTGVARCIEARMSRLLSRNLRLLPVAVHPRNALG